MKRSDFSHHVASLLRIRAPGFVVLGLVAIHGLVMLLHDAPDRMFALYEYLGLHWQTFKSGWVWQIWTYAFLHGGGFHLGVNALGIILLGSRVEHIIGSRGFLRVCFLGILGGGAAHLVGAASGAGAPILVGFSGAMMALLLLLTTLSPESRMWPLPLSGRSIGLGILIAEGFLALMDPSLGLPVVSRIGIWIASNGGASWFDIAHACHFGGGIAGWLYGRWLLRHRVSLKSLRRARERREADRCAGSQRPPR